MAQQILNRRTFVGTAAAGLTLMGARAADKPRRVALVGSGWYGKNDLFRLVQVEDVEIVALCDPDSQSLAADAKTAAKRHKSGKAPTTYGDYRELLKQEQPDIVEVATPDHWHCLPAIEAMQAGADVYVQK
ncbi:MAG: Gfo/Idh/MocA family oxidoreductase, partial [Bryobacterales bacterium]|nr:Gfo/Idh/MocA family oxidoreductase [Bryobacterales bacterium]